MSKFKAFLQRKNIIFSGKRYGIDALGAMAQGLFCTLLVGTILNTIGQQFSIAFLSKTIVANYTIGGLASAMVGPGIAVAIGFALGCPQLVLFSLIPVGFAANAMGSTPETGRSCPSRLSSPINALVDLGRRTPPQAARILSRMGRS